MFGGCKVVLASENDGKKELIPKLEICFLGLVLRIINQAQDHENNFENSQWLRVKWLLE